MIFQPLHLHSAFSMGDALIKVPDLVGECQKNGLTHAVITDHGNLNAFGKLYFSCKGTPVIPVAGCEMYVNDRLSEVLNGTPEDSKKIHKQFTSHLVVIAKNQQGYKNLVNLINMSVNQFYNKPLVSTEQLAEHSEGLIVTSACFGGIVGNWYEQGRLDVAKQMAEIYKEIFGDDFYIELSCVDITSLNGTLESVKFNDFLIQLANSIGCQTLVSNDAHYLKPEDRYAQYLLQLFREGLTVADVENPSKKHKNSIAHAKSMCNETYFKTYEQIRSYWDSSLKSDVFNSKEFDKAIQNGIDVVQSKIGKFIPKIMPTMPRPQDVTFEQLRKKVTDKFHEKGLDKKGKIYADRLKKELDVMELLKIDSYIAVLDDFVTWTKTNYGRASMSPGRGSAVSSLVLYCLDITGLDPIKHNLLFERFLDESNLESGLSPDIDLDFSQNIREYVKDYILAKYKNSANIGTLTEYKWKNLIKDVLRFYKVDYSESNKMTEEIAPEDDGVSFAELETRCPKVYAKITELLGDKIGVMDAIHGTFRSNGKHAAGVLISDEKNTLTDMIPYTRYNDQIVTGWDGKQLSDLGFLKYDILGLVNVQVVDDATVHIRNHRHCYRVMDMMTCNIPKFIADAMKEKGFPMEDGGPAEIDIFNDCDIDDPAIYEFANKESMAYDSVFQFGTDVAAQMLEKAKPKNFEDLEAMNAILRPATIRYGTTDKYIQCMNSGRKADLPPILDFLGKTHGIMVFQEQCMQAGMVIGGFSPREAKKVMKLLVKKKKSNMEEVNSYKSRFMAGANGKIDEQTAERLWDEMVRMSEYAFCKAHAAAYTMLAVHDLWLKYYYCYEFYTAVLNNLGDSDLDKIRETIQKIHGKKAYFHIGTEKIEYPIKIVPPNVCDPTKEFSLDEKYHIRYGMSYVKSLTVIDLDKLIKHNAPFKSYHEFISFCITNKFNRASIKALIFCGACDVFGESRNAMWQKFMGYKNSAYDDQEDDLNFSTEQLVEMEAKYCGVSFDMITESSTLKADNTVEEVKNGTDGKYEIVVTVKDIVKRSTKKDNKPYLLMTTAETCNMFIWDMDKFLKDDIRVGETIRCKIKKSGSFCQFLKTTGRINIAKVLKNNVKYAQCARAASKPSVKQQELGL